MRTLILSLLFPAFAFAGPVLQGGADGGGGYQHTNAKLLLRVVADGLARDLKVMDDAAFTQFPKDFGRLELADIIKDVVYEPSKSIERENADGQMEPLMFDYSREFCDKKGCGPRIIALRGFFETYNSVPVQQLESERSQEKMYLLTIADIRQRLLHEAAHLFNIGNSAATNDDADKFAKAVLQAVDAQYISCQAKYAMGRRIPAFVLHMHSGLLTLTSQRIQDGDDIERARGNGLELNKRVIESSLSQKEADGLLVLKPSYYSRSNKAVPTKYFSIPTVARFLKWNGGGYDIVLNLVTRNANVIVRQNYPKIRMKCEVTSPVIPLSY